MSWTRMNDDWKAQAKEWRIRKTETAIIIEASRRRKIVKVTIWWEIERTNEERKRKVIRTNESWAEQIILKASDSSLGQHIWHF